MTIIAAPRNPTIADLWRELRAWLAAASADSRGPAAVATLLAHAAYAAIKRRLLFIESLLMKLLLIEAARLPTPKHPFPDARKARIPGPMNTNTAGMSAVPKASHSAAAAFMGPGPPASPRPGNRWAKGEDPTRPETWRVRFRPRLRGLLKQAPVKLRPRPFPTYRTPAAARARAKARALARRFESLRRVIANPRRAIAALARRLHARGQAARALAHAIALSRPPRCASMPMLLAHAIVRANDARTAFHNTS